MALEQNWAAGIAMQAGLVPWITGMPGTAKTACFETLATATQRRLLPIMLAQRMPEDISGIPKETEFEIAGQRMDGYRLLRMEEVLRARHEPTMLLFDEFNQGGREIMGAVQQWINNPPPLCWMACLGNPVEQSTSGQELAPPVINRMIQIPWETPWESILIGYRNGFSNYPVPDWPVLPADWETLRPTFGGLIADWVEADRIRFSDEALYPRDPHDASNPWCSPRSIAAAGISLAAATSVGASKQTKAALVNGAVGQAYGPQLLNYLDQQDLPDPRELLADPSKLVLPKRFDLALTVVGGVVGCMVADKSPETFEQCMDFIAAVYEQSAEIATLSEGRLYHYQQEYCPAYQPRKRNGCFQEMAKARLAMAGMS